MVGYWAEARLFGVVVVVDRGEDETGVSCSHCYLNSYMVKADSSTSSATMSSSTRLGDADSSFSFQGNNSKALVLFS